jgi:hypothetical protein
MKKKQRDDDSPQHVSPGERETRNRADEQDFDKPEEGRDVPPEEAGKPKRDPNSPWLGGG